MGAGTGAAGSAPAGADPFTSTPPGTVVQLDPVRYDPSTRSFPRDPDTGLIETIHWVDAAVVLALTIQNGSHASYTTLGNALRDIVRAGGPSLQSQVEDRVRIALKALLDRKDIVVTSIQTATPLRGQVVVAVSYINLRRSPTLPPKNVKLVLS